MMCGFLPAKLEGETCFYGHDCDEGLDCFALTCLPKDVPLDGACSVMEQCLPGLECRDMMCEVPLLALGEMCEMTE